MLADLGITPDRLAPLSYNCLRQREEDTVSHAIDFGELKQRVSIERAVEMLGIKLTKSGPQLRGPCPICKAGGDRAFVVTPAKGLYYCFGACGKGGDAITMAARRASLVFERTAPCAEFVIFAPSNVVRNPLIRHSHAHPIRCEKTYLGTDSNQRRTRRRAYTYSI